MVMAVAISAVVVMINVVVLTEMGSFAVSRVKDVVRTVAARVMFSSAVVTVSAAEMTIIAAIITMIATT